MRISLIFFILFVVVSGCGRKGPPLPPDFSEVPPVNSVDGSVNNGVLTLVWQKPTGRNAGIIDGFQVYRSKKRSDAELCEGCPLIFERVKATDKNICRYSENLETGMAYIYKVVSYSSNGAVSSDSPFYKVTN
jgi:predicted small lipoprotein YifL